MMYFISIPQNLQQCKSQKKNRKYVHYVLHHVLVAGKGCKSYGALNTCPSIGVAKPLNGEVPHVVFEKISAVVVTWRL